MVTIEINSESIQRCCPIVLNLSLFHTILWSLGICKVTHSRALVNVTLHCRIKSTTMGCSGQILKMFCNFKSREIKFLLFTVTGTLKTLAD